MRFVRSAFAVVAAIAVLTAGVAAYADDSDASGSSSGRAGRKQPEPTSLSSLAVIEAGGGTFDADSSRLTLTDVTPTAVWFTDRPARRAGSYDVATVFSLFFDDQTPPNAALEYDQERSGRGVTVLEISMPSYDGDTGTLTLDAKILDDPEKDLHTGSALVDFSSRHDPMLPSSFTAPTLFVDSGLTEGEPTADGATTSAAHCEPRSFFPEFDTYLSVECTFEGDVKPWSPVDHDMNCNNYKDQYRFPEYVRRRPGDPPTIADEPFIDKHDTPTNRVHISWVATDSEVNKVGSRKATAIRISLGTNPDHGDQHYKVSVWCTVESGAWIIFG
jgi:hypothetical protein